jgi:F-type H+-transporting ATPase subunit beta
VLLLMDNVFRFVQAGSEVSGLLGRLPSRVGYQPTLETEVAELQERIASVGNASVTAIEAVYVPADDFTDPAVTAIASPCRQHGGAEPAMAADGIYPAIDPIASSSVLLDPLIVGRACDHCRAGARGDRALPRIARRDRAARRRGTGRGGAPRCRPRAPAAALPDPALLRHRADYTGMGCRARAARSPWPTPSRGCRAILDGLECDDWERDSGRSTWSAMPTSS